MAGCKFFSVCLMLSLFSGSAIAEKNSKSQVAVAKNPAPAANLYQTPVPKPATKSGVASLAGQERLRSASAELAQAAPGTASAPGKLTLAKTEETKFGARDSIAQEVGPKKVVEASPIDQILPVIEKAILAKHPKASGRVQLTFSVGQKGKLGDVMVVSFDAGLDAEMEKQLSQLSLTKAPTLPAISTAVTFRNGKLIRR